MRDAESDAAMVALLRESDARCPRCGYRLRGATAAQCPECGETITLGALTRRRGASLSWAVALVALATCLPESWVKWQRLLFKPGGRVYYGDERFPWMTPYPYGMNPPPYAPPGWSSDPLQWYHWALFGLSYAFWIGVPAAVVAMALNHRRWAAMPRGWRCAAAAVITLAVLLAFRRWMFWYWWWVADPQTGWPPGDLWWMRR